MTAFVGADENALDTELFAAWMAGDRRAGEHLLRDVHARLLEYFRRRSPRFQEDLAARAAESFVRSRHLYRGDGEVQAFVFGIAFRVWTRHMRRERRNPLGCFEQVELGQHPTSTHKRRMEARILLAEVLEMVPNLRPIPRVAIELTLQGLTPKEIHAQFFADEAMGTITSRLRIGREALTKMVEARHAA